ncbi:MAG TPA: cbb3-type cytochrome c oxidase subunit I [Thermoanaerobaculia bacterium]|nr:cbb3-type cytochrome c oxidase subunit I [Thermoanaerobaculia bacterium]
MSAAAAPGARRPAGLALANFWVGFGLFAIAAILGLYQLLERSGHLPASASAYYESTTLHGVVMAYVLTTFFIVGFGFFVTATALGRPLRAPRIAWAGFATMLFGTLVAAFSIVSGKATILYTFYPPQLAHWSFYAGAALLLVGSIPWIVITMLMTRDWKRENPGRPVPLAQFGMTACALLWAWTLVGVVAEVVFQLLPASLGLASTIDVGLARALFAWTLHPIVYFWLIPAYVTLYTIVPKAAGGYLFSDEMGRVVFVMLLVFSLPIGLHHIFVDPQQAAGWKLMHAFGTFLVAVPTLLTGFTVAASLETAGRLRGGRGLFGWIRALPWGEPVVLGGILAAILLLPGGFGGLVNASYAMDAMVHNTMWITAHFHLIFGGTVVIMYFASAYALWPKLTGRRLFSRRMANVQLWTWFAGILTLTVPWHYLGLLWMPRRTAYSPYDPGIVARWRPWESVMIAGGVLLVVSGLLLVGNLLLTHLVRQRVADREPAYAETAVPLVSVPPLLNGFALWNGLVAVLMLLAWAYPIGQFFFMNVHKSLPWGPK